MNRTVKAAVVATLVAVVFGCAQYGGVSTLRGADVAMADKAPDSSLEYVGKKPGLQKPIERTFSTQPPLIPHAVANFDEITVAENQCLDCHSLETYRKKNAPKMGDSHLAFSKDGMKKVVTMDRYQCNSCHVPQVDAKPLVDNTFVGNVQK